MRIHLLLILFISSSCFGQSYLVKKDSLITFLYNSKGNIEEINSFPKRSKIYLPIKIATSIPEQKLIKTNKGLYIQIDGTGQVYKATKTNKAEIVFSRVDSTTYFGHNFGSIKFSYLDTIYNLGGNGYWHFFGHLIYFNEGKEWEIKKINEEFTVNSANHYYNQPNGTLYYIQNPYNEVSTNKSIGTTKLLKLNLKSKKNEFLGVIDESKFKYNELSTYVFSKKLNGSICQYLNDYYLLNYEQNTISKLKNLNLINELNGTNKLQTEVAFEKNGVVYLSYGNNRDLKPLIFKESDFELTKYKIYLKDHSTIYLIISVFFLLLLSIILIKFKYIKSRFINIFSKQNNTNDLEFTQIEKSLIQLLISKIDTQKYYDAEDVNKVLGVAKKSLDVQKKLRTEHIHRINHKFKVNYNVNVDLIERHKTEEDRRFLKYGISKGNSIIYKSK